MENFSKKLNKSKINAICL